MPERSLRALVVYYTKTGHTADAARYVAEGLEEGGAETQVMDVEAVEPARVHDYDILAVGSPCHAGSMPVGGGVAGAVTDWLEDIPDPGLEGMVAGAFCPYSTAGGNRTVHTLDHRLREMGADVPEAGVAVKAGIPFSLWRGPEIGMQDAERLRELGHAMAAAVPDSARQQGADSE